jgi:hypothetical protein
MHFLRNLILSFFFLSYSPSFAQVIGDFIEDESTLYAQTKQINQFIKRFNLEENGLGSPLNTNDPDYKNPETRYNFLPQLFDLQKFKRNDSLLLKFATEVTKPTNQQFLNFESDDWFAELDCDFAYEGKKVNIKLFFKLVKAEKGTKWIIENIYFENYAKALPFREKDPMRFLHPLSHELDFMNIAKVFRDLETVEDYTLKEHQPDYLSIFLYEIKTGRLKFKSVKNLSIHFFQIDNWYFSINDINRSGFNSGWLITQFKPIDEPTKNRLLNRIYRNTDF